MDIAGVFGRDNDITLAQECARAAVVFLYGLVLVRLSGRRAFGKWGALDIVVSIIVGSNLSRALTGSAPFAGTLAATAVLMLLHWLFALAAARSPALSRLIEGGAILLARDGRIEHGVRIRHTVSEADIDEALREKGAADLAENSDVHRRLRDRSRERTVPRLRAHDRRDRALAGGKRCRAPRDPGVPPGARDQ